MASEPTPEERQTLRESIREVVRREVLGGPYHTSNMWDVYDGRTLSGPWVEEECRRAWEAFDEAYPEVKGDDDGE